MRIQPAMNYCYCNNSTQYSKSKHLSNPSFKSITLGNFLIYLVAKEGISSAFSTLGKYKHYKYLSALKEHIDGCYNEKDFPAVLQALTKTSNDFYDGHSKKINFLAFMDEKKLDSVMDLRWGGLKKLAWYDIKDDSYNNIQTKKDFLMSFIDNNHPISPRLVWYFRKLNDNLYSTFKAEFIDKALFSEKYNQGRSNGEILKNRYDSKYEYDEYKWDFHSLNSIFWAHWKKKFDITATICYQNLQLISTLDKKLFGGYIEKRRNVIEESKQYIEKAMAEGKNDHGCHWGDTEKSLEYDYNNILKHI